MQTLTIRGEKLTGDTNTKWEYFQRWMSVLLLGSTYLSSLSLNSDGIPWPSVLSLLTLQHLELTIDSDGPWLSAVTADLSFCSHLQTLKIRQKYLSYEDSYYPPMSLPNLLLHDLASLKSLELIGLYPRYQFTLPAGCLLRLIVVEELPPMGQSAEIRMPRINAYLSLLDATSLARWSSEIVSLALLGALLHEHAGSRPGSSSEYPTCLFRVYRVQHIGFY